MWRVICNVGLRVIQLPNHTSDLTKLDHREASESPIW